MSNNQEEPRNNNKKLPIEDESLLTSVSGGNQEDKNLVDYATDQISYPESPIIEGQIEKAFKKKSRLHLGNKHYKKIMRGYRRRNENEDE